MTYSEHDVLPADEGPLDQRLLDQTAMVLWNELERHFARGVVLNVDQSLDLVEVAINIVNDNAEQIRMWMKSGRIEALSDDTASRWSTNQCIIWAVVAAPWVLAQENVAAKTYPGKLREE